MNDPIQFDPNDFNKKYSELEYVNKQNTELIEQQKLNKLNQQLKQVKSPQQEIGVNIAIDTMNVLVRTLNTLLDGKNPVPFLFQDDRNILASAILFIIIGAFLLLVTNLLKA